MIETCPSTPDLERFLLGQSVAEDAERLEQHLTRCSQCLKTLQALKGEDTLVELMRSEGSRVGSLPSAQVQALIARLRALSSRAARPVPERTVSPVSGAAKPTGQGYAFLAPPEGPGEIGRLGAYRVLEVLGQGGMGVVFRAEGLQLHRTVALKAMLPAVAQKPGARERFLREARAAAQLEHDHIVPIYQVGEHGGAPFIAMPFLKGASLEDFLKQREHQSSPLSAGGEGPEARGHMALTLGQVLRIGREIAEGLAAAHEHGVIHRDIKPANIWLDSAAGGRARILDFGLARATSGEQNLTHSGAIVGTPAYMAPEQAKGETIDGRADLFSLGVILYRLCTGELPFQGSDVMSTLLALATHEPPPPRAINPALPPSLSDLVMQLLAKDPGRRPADAREVARALQAIEQKAQPPRSPTAEPPTVSVSRTKALESSMGSAVTDGSNAKRRRGWVIAAGLLLLIGGGIYLGSTLPRSPAPEGTTEELPIPPATWPEIVRKEQFPFSPFDRLRRADIPPEKLQAAGRGDPRQVPPEVVADLGVSLPKRERFGVSMALHPDGQTLALGFQANERVIFWHVPTGKERLFATELARVERMRFSHDGKVLAISTYYGTRLWDVAGARPLQTLFPQHYAETQVHFSPDDRVVFAGRWGGSGPKRPFVKVQHVTGRVPSDSVEPPVPEDSQYPVKALALSPDGSLLAICGGLQVQTNFVKVWDSRSGKLLRTLKQSLRWAHVLVFSRNGQRLFQAREYDRYVYVFDATTGQALGRFRDHTGFVTDFALSPDGTLAASCDEAGEVILWDPDTLQKQRVLRLNPPHSLTLEVLFTPDGRHLLTRNLDGTVYVVRLAAPPGPAPAAPGK